MRDPGSDKIRQLFEAQKADDRREAPSLSELLAPAPPGWARQPLWQAAAALSLALLIATAFWFLRVSPPADGGISALSQWKSPTDFLLAAEADRMLTEAPRWQDEAYPSARLMALDPVEGSTLETTKPAQETREDR